MKFFIILILLFSQIDAMEKLPENMPNELVIEYFKTLGQAGKGFLMRLSVDTCKYEDRFINRQNEFRFSLEKKEFADLYNALKKNNVHRIENDKKFINDYDAESLKISWNKNSIEINQSGQRIKSNWLAEWKNITVLLEKIKEREIVKAQVEIELQIDKSLIGNFLHLQIDSANFSLRLYIDEKSLIENSIKIKMLPGHHLVYCTLYKDYDLKKKKEIYSDFDSARASIWEEKHSKYIRSLKKESISLMIDSLNKKSFLLKKIKRKLEIQ